MATERDHAETHVLTALIEGDEAHAVRILDCFSTEDRAAFSVVAAKLFDVINADGAPVPAPRHAAAPVAS